MAGIAFVDASTIDQDLGIVPILQHRRHDASHRLGRREICFVDARLAAESLDGFFRLYIREVSLGTR